MRTLFVAVLLALANAALADEMIWLGSPSDSHDGKAVPACIVTVNGGLSFWAPCPADGVSDPGTVAHETGLVGVFASRDK